MAELPAIKDDDNPVDIMEKLPTKVESRCNVCQSEFREVIDRLLVAGHSVAGIARQFHNRDDRFRRSMESTRKSIERHKSRHLSVRDDAVRRMLEARIRESGVLVDAVEGQLVNIEALYEMIVAKGQEQISAPDSRVKYQDVLDAAAKLNDLQKDRMAEQLEITQRQVEAISLAVRELVPPELLPSIVARARELFDKPLIDIPGVVVEHEEEEQRELEAAVHE